MCNSKINPGVRCLTRSIDLFYEASTSHLSLSPFYIIIILSFIYPTVTVEPLLIGHLNHLS